MKIAHSPYIKAFLEAANKKYLVETKQQSLKLKKEFNLRPLTDLDDKIISYSPYPNNTKFTNPTQFEDCFEKMSFEQPTPDIDIWRDSELYRVGEDSKRYLREQYNPDDIPLADSLSNRTYSQYNYRISKEYYPDTDLSFEEQSVLKLIEFTENVVPNSLPKRLRDDYSTVRTYALAAVNAWENGISTNAISQLIEKSILKGNKVTPKEANVDLFNFLTRHPNKRSVVVLKTAKDGEIFDKTAATYYNLFEKKYFSDSQKSIEVLSQCKTKESGYPQVNAKLCEIATLLRRRSALGLPEKQTSTYSFMQQKPSKICPIETPWGNTETELLQKLKPDGMLNEEYYNAAKSMLSDNRKTAKYVLENIDNVVKRNNEIQNLKNEYDRIYSSNRFYAEKYEIIKYLQNELSENIQKTDDLPKEFIMFDMAKLVQEKNLSIKSTYSILERINYIKKYDMKRYNNKSLQHFKKAIEACIDTKTFGKKNSELLSNLCCNLHKEVGSFGEKEAAIIDKVCKNTTNDTNHYISALDVMIQLHHSPRKQITKIANENLDECAKYMERYNKTVKENSTYKEHKHFIDNILLSEIKRFISTEKVNSDDSKILPKLEDMCTDKISYFEFLEQIKEMGASL